MERHARTALSSRKLRLRLALIALASGLPASSLAASADHQTPVFVNAPVVQSVPEAEPAVDEAAPVDTVEDDAFAEIDGGMASFYGKELAGRPTASGERFDPSDLTAAHRTLPFGSKVRVTCERTGKSVMVRINDRGPFTRGRTIDLSRAAAEAIGLVGRGHGRVKLALAI